MEINLPDWLYFLADEGIQPPTYVDCLTTAEFIQEYGPMATLFNQEEPLQETDEGSGRELRKHIIDNDITHPTATHKSIQKEKGEKLFYTFV